MSVALENIVRELFDRETEGEYWDFKEYPYFYKGQEKSEQSKKRSDLLHDIICMANNLSNKEAYIIMGISDKPVRIKGIEKFENRWNQEQYQDFLQNQSWAGDYIPEVSLKTIKTDGETELDILIIHKTSNVPYYLKKKYQSVNENQIYVRKGAKNTSKNLQAEIQDIEKLWLFRFGLIPNPKERVEQYLTDLDGWTKMKSDYETIAWYYARFPEYTIEFINDPEDASLHTPTFALFQMNARSSWHILRIKYHQTILMEFSAHFIDEARGIAIHPKIGILKIFEVGGTYTNSYYYYYQDSVEINMMYLLKQLMNYEEGAWLRHLSLIPIFENETERVNVEEIVNQHVEESREQIKVLEKKQVVGYNSDLTKNQKELEKKDIAVSLLMKKRLQEFRVSNI